MPNTNRRHRRHTYNILCVNADDHIMGNAVRIKYFDILLVIICEFTTLRSENNENRIQSYSIGNIVMID